MPRVRIARSVEIDRPIGEVFAFVFDARNDPRWCHKVESVELVGGGEPAPGARYAVVHRPIPGRPTRRMDYECVAAEPPRRVSWREDDGTDRIDVTYLLDHVGEVRT